MEKTLVIDGRQVRFKSTGAFLLRYKAQFKRDALKDLMKLESAINKDTGELDNYEALDLETFYNLAWVLAKVADPSIPDPMTWLDSFSEFPIGDIITELQDVIGASIQVSKKN